MTPRVFDISMPRTGTRSLTVAMQRLGYTTWHGPSPHEDRLFVEQVLAGTFAYGSIVGSYDFLSHVGPWYQELAELWPDARFILLDRPILPWLLSCRRHWIKSHKGARPAATIGEREVVIPLSRLLSMLYFCGAIDVDRDHFVCCYRAHRRDVVRYFAARNERHRLLQLTLAQNVFWRRLCRFLDIADIPRCGVPHIKRVRAQLNTRRPISVEQWNKRFSNQLAESTH